jgi:hypothetical protein
VPRVVFPTHSRVPNWLVIASVAVSQARTTFCVKRAVAANRKVTFRRELPAIHGVALYAVGKLRSSVPTGATPCMAVGSVWPRIGCTIIVFNAIQLEGKVAGESRVSASLNAGHGCLRVPCFVPQAGLVDWPVIREAYWAGD